MDMALKIIVLLISMAGLFWLLTILAPFAEVALYSLVIAAAVYGGIHVGGEWGTLIAFAGTLPAGFLLIRRLLFLRKEERRKAEQKHAREAPPPPEKTTD